ncbi:hypothetical protein J4461_00385 [Candidatus Pacearchaeota archaeon]|nr:hypothetical protein [Candidatus Pacearchaeota archaeon]
MNYKESVHTPIYVGLELSNSGITSLFFLRGLKRKSGKSYVMLENIAGSRETELLIEPDWVIIRENRDGVKVDYHGAKLGDLYRGEVSCVKHGRNFGNFILGRYPNSHLIRAYVESISGK